MAELNSINGTDDTWKGDYDSSVAAAGMTLSGTTIATDGTDANIDITMTPKGTGTVNPSALSVNSVYTFPTADGNASDVLTTDGSGGVTWEAVGSSAGEVVQVQYGDTATTFALAGNIGTIPGDDTIPAITEGEEFLTLAITPTSATNYLLIEASVHAHAVNTSQVLQCIALFQDATTNALACAWNNTNTAQSVGGSISLQYRMVAGTTSSTTFRLRHGQNQNDAAGTSYINRVAGSRLYGARLITSIKITEIAV